MTKTWRRRLRKAFGHVAARLKPCPDTKLVTEVLSAGFIRRALGPNFRFLLLAANVLASLRCGDLLHHLVGGAGFVDAEGFLREEVSAGGVSASAAPHAYMTELAAAALPFQVVVVTQFVKDDRVGPDVGETLLTKVTCEGGQVSTRKNLSFV